VNAQQTAYLENLLQSSSVETLSTGILSALLHLHENDPRDLLSLSLICSGLWHDHPDATSALSLLKSSELLEGADIFMRLSNILAEHAGTVSETGSENLEPELPLFQSTTENLEPPTT